MGTLYFDTNIYSFICATSEGASVRRVLKKHKLSLVASSSNLFEIFSINSSEKAKNELSMIAELATCYEEYPQSWRHAFELRQEIRLLRPQWYRRIPSPNRIREFLKQHRKLWQLARSGEIPERGSYSIYRRDFEQGVANLTANQKDFRRSLRAETSHYRILSPGGEEIPVDAANPETYWRISNLQVWYNAIQLANPASRDYSDWLSPYIKRNSFNDESYRHFWLHEANPGRLPFNRLIGLIHYYQSTKKVTHGNSQDQSHASNWLSVDLFLTADRAFFEILLKVAENHFPGRPLPALVTRSASSAADEIDRVISTRMA